MIGGKITHNCGLSRSIGWFVEGILPLAFFCKDPLRLTLEGLTHDDVDLSTDILSSVTFPLLQNFGIYNIQCKVRKRGVPPKGGGLVEITIPTVKTSLQSIYVIDEGLVKKVRGIAFCTRISPTVMTRVIDACRKVLHDYLPDVYIHTDHYKGGQEGGHSPGYSLSLVAETTTGALISVERTAKLRRDRVLAGLIAFEEAAMEEDPDNATSSSFGELPETIGEEAGHLLLGEVFSGGVIDHTHQSLILQLMILTPEDVSKVCISIHLLRFSFAYERFLV
jgi:RNA 3'-terminal phosphate cyclase-like protein